MQSFQAEPVHQAAAFPLGPLIRASSFGQAVDRTRTGTVRTPNRSSAQRSYPASQYSAFCSCASSDRLCDLLARRRGGGRHLPASALPGRVSIRRGRTHSGARNNSLGLVVRKMRFQIAHREERLCQSSHGAARNGWQLVPVWGGRIRWKPYSTSAFPLARRMSQPKSHICWSSMRGAAFADGTGGKASWSYPRIYPVLPPCGVSNVTGTGSFEKRFHTSARLSSAYRPKAPCSICG